MERVIACVPLRCTMKVLNNLSFIQKREKTGAIVWNRVLNPWFKMLCSALPNNMYLQWYNRIFVTSHDHCEKLMNGTIVFFFLFCRVHESNLVCFN